jgi:hypothetical protein
MNGATSHRRFYGYSGVEFVFPQSGGGTLSFLLWNDQNRARLSTLNYLAVVLNGQNFLLESYSTPFDLKEFYVKDPNEWGPGGGSQVQIAIPPDLKSLSVSSEGSETGIEISDVRYSGGGLSGSPVAYQPAVNTIQECQMAFGRIMHGAQSKTNFYGYSGGEIHLPNRRGGMLTFRYWNDEGRTRSSTTNVLAVQVGEQVHFFRQYSTPLDLQEYYTEDPKEWGPGGGSVVRVQVPPGIGRLQFSNPGSETGIEISEVRFVTGASLGHDYVYEEHVNWTDKTINLFGRVLAGQRSGKKFYGYSGGTVVLPHRKGGRLSLVAWNDQNRGTASTTNSIRYSYGGLRGAAVVTSTNTALGEFYVENPNEWGPGGGRELNLDIPPGVSRVEFGNEGSQTGVEISDIVFRSQQATFTHAGPCGATGVQSPLPPLTPAQPTQPVQPPPVVPPAPPVTLGPGGESKVLSDNWNTAGCGFTGSAQMNLVQPAYVERVTLWYNWAAGETSLPYELSRGGSVLRSGEFRRGSCDPYQTAWCEATDTIRVKLAPGSYTFTTARKRVCQNGGSNGAGFIRVTGRTGLGGGEAPSAETETQPSPPATPEIAAGPLGNLALGKPAQQSSTYSGAYPASNGVDGRKDNSSMFHTNSEQNAWWQVDLQGNYALSHIVLYNRTDCCTERQRTLQVMLSQNGSNWQTIYAHPGADFRELRVEAGGRTARYVRVQLAEPNYFHLQEVEVFGAR